MSLGPWDCCVSLSPEQYLLSSLSVCLKALEFITKFCVLSVLQGLSVLNVRLVCFNLLTHCSLTSGGCVYWIGFYQWIMTICLVSTISLEAPSD